MRRVARDKVFFLKRLVFALSAPVISCSSAGGSSEPPPPAPSSSSDPASPTVSCEKDPRVDAYVANLEKTSTSGMKIVLLASDPAPPIRGTNNWTLKVTDAQGQPVTNAAMTVTPFMPDHGHGTSVRPTLVPGPDGSYTIKNLYFFMPGVWRITIANGTDSALFHFCVAG